MGFGGEVAVGLGVLGSGLGWRWVLVVVVAVGDWGWRWVCGCVRCVGVRGIWEEEDGFWVLPLRPTPPSSPASPLPYLEPFFSFSAWIVGWWVAGIVCRSGSWRVVVGVDGEADGSGGRSRSLRWRDRV